jgi:hypothetical protein
MLNAILSLFRMILLILGGYEQVALENLALREQLAIFQRSVRHPKIRPTDRLFWVCLRKVWKEWKSALVIVRNQADGGTSILAETGMDMSPEGPFPDCHHPASWAAICPGNNESAGKRRSGQTRRGNPWLRGMVTQTGWAAAGAKNSLFSVCYQRVKLRRGGQRAVIAIGHVQLIAVGFLKVHRRSRFSGSGEWNETTSPSA